jgi:gamma-glutamylcyclotransferase (GGCT)/AIG2-like uncharacterized protein YtfP
LSVVRLFVYGTLLDPALVTRLTGQPAHLEPASLAGYRRVQLRGTPYPTLRRARDAVAGAVLSADLASFRRLHAYEGPRYRLTRVRPVVGGKTVNARAWIAPDATNRPWP